MRKQSTRWKAHPSFTERALTHRQVLAVIAMSVCPKDSWLPATVPWAAITRTFPLDCLLQLHHEYEPTSCRKAH